MNCSMIETFKSWNQFIIRLYVGLQYDNKINHMKSHFLFM